MKSIRYLAMILVLAVVGVSTLACHSAITVDQSLILISVDGFRWDYLDDQNTPNLARLASEGVQAEGLIPVYPSKTFPSHYSIVTGLYPGNHGIISNNIFDHETGDEFHLSVRSAVQPFAPG